ncbi:hypothetical protein ACROYT_G036722 [Oculina patagonica]
MSSHKIVTVRSQYHATLFPCPRPSPPSLISRAPSTFEQRTNEKRRSRPKARIFIGVPQPSVFVVWVFLCCVYYSLSVYRNIK